jgi:metaxin
LNIAGIDHRLISSNNHASPTGSLPFLLPAVYGANASADHTIPIVSNKLTKYAAEHGGKVDESPSIRYEAYQSLIDHRIRNCWVSILDLSYEVIVTIEQLYTLYLEPENFSAVAYHLYVSSASSNLFVRAAISHQLRTAAEAELLRHTSIIDTDDLYSEADKAFEALSILLGDDDWFFGNGSPGLFDASVFAYTQLLLDDTLGWKEKKLCRALRRKENLVQHRERLRVRYYGG